MPVAICIMCVSIHMLLCNMLCTHVCVHCTISFIVLIHYSRSKELVCLIAPSLGKDPLLYFRSMCDSCSVKGGFEATVPPCMHPYVSLLTS